ncbi:MAG: hypothetical protein WAM53_15425 [Terrimicrobiaceae bacterium]|jgi:hypothetical protein
MRKVISISEIVAPFRAREDACEVWARADADYDEAKSQVDVRLDSFLRRSSDGQRLPANWLPAAETVTEAVPFDEGSPATREIFETWVQRVRRAIPSSE